MEDQRPGSVGPLYSGQRVPRTVCDWHRIGSAVASAGLCLIIVIIILAVLLFPGTLLQVLHGIGTLFGWLPGQVLARGRARGKFRPSAGGQGSLPAAAIGRNESAPGPGLWWCGPGGLRVSPGLDLGVLGVPEGADAGSSASAAVRASRRDRLDAAPLAIAQVMALGRG